MRTPNNNSVSTSADIVRVVYELLGCTNEDEKAPFMEYALSDFGSLYSVLANNESLKLNVTEKMVFDALLELKKSYSTFNN